MELKDLSLSELKTLKRVVFSKYEDESEKGNHKFASELFYWTLDIDYWIHYRTHEHDNEGESLIDWVNRKAKEREAEEAKA